MIERADENQPPYIVLRVPENLDKKGVAEVQEMVARAAMERFCMFQDPRNSVAPLQEKPYFHVRSTFALPHDFNQRYVGKLVKRAVDEVLRKYHRAAPKDSQAKANDRLSALLRALADYYGYEMKRIPGLKTFLLSMQDHHPKLLAKIYAENQRRFRLPHLSNIVRSYYINPNRFADFT